MPSVSDEKVIGLYKAEAEKTGGGCRLVTDSPSAVDTERPAAKKRTNVMLRFGPA